MNPQIATDSGSFVAALTWYFDELHSCPLSAFSIAQSGLTILPAMWLSNRYFGLRGFKLNLSIGIVAGLDFL